MDTPRLVSDSLRALLRYKLRTGFVMLGSLIGVAALTFVVSVGRGAEQKMLRTVRQLFSASSILVSTGGNLLMGGPRAGGARLTLDDMETVAAALPAIAAWDPVEALADASVRYGDTATRVRVLGGSDRAERVWDRGVSRGEYFDATAVAHAARVALIGETAARALFAGDDPLGKEVLVGSVPLRILGVLEALGTDAHGMDRDNELLVPISTMMRRLANVDTIRGAKILTKSTAEVEGTAREVTRILRERHAIAPGAPADFTVLTPIEVQQMVGRMQRVLFVFLPLVAVVALLAGGAVAASLMLLSVGERVGEIGLRRAVGARPRDIALQFLCETAATTVTGGVAGLVIGAGASLAVARRFGLSESLSWKAAVGGLVFAALVGLVAGIFPARRAAALEPVDALR